MFGDDSGYDLTDPKHPGYHDRMSSLADERRKREREEPPPPDDGQTPARESQGIAVITDLEKFLTRRGVDDDTRELLHAHVYQAFCAGFLLEHGTAYKTASRYPFGGLHPDDERLRPAYDDWATHRWDY